MTEEKITKKKSTVPTFTKEQFLNAKNPDYNLDAMFVVLEEGKTYSKEEANKLYEEFMNKEVK